MFIKDHRDTENIWCSKTKVENVLRLVLEKNNYVFSGVSEMKCMH